MSNIRIKLSCNIPRPVRSGTAPDIILDRTLAATQKGGPNQSLLVRNPVTVGHRKILDLFAEYYAHTVPYVGRCSMGVPLTKLGDGAGTSPSFLWEQPKGLK